MEYPLDLEIDVTLSERLNNYFSYDNLEKIARESRFVERSTSRLTGQNFLMLNIFNEENGKESSLTTMCDYLEEHFSIQMTKQSLDERYNTYSVKFMKMCYETLISQVLQSYTTEKSTTRPLIFSQIELTDATSFKIPDHLSVFYKGGGNVEASIKIHHRYNLLQGERAATKIVSGNENDALYLEDINTQIAEGCLYLKDLGYYKLGHLKKIDTAKGYFLSRFRSLTNCFIKREGEFHSISIQELSKQKEHTEIYLGKGKEKVKVRMVIEPMPEETIEKRLIRAKTASKKQYAQIQDETLFLCYYNVYITNIESQHLPLEWIRFFYALRWQIELIFKAWKSLFEIDEVKKMSIFRFECYIYGRLMAIFLSEKVQNLFKDYLWEDQELEISNYKSFSILKKT
jgi:Transposase DDE domain